MRSPAASAASSCRSGWRSCCGERLAVVVNTGDDFEHLGLHISPDVDTVLYTLAGLVNEETGWGRREETWTFMRALGELGGPTWFKLGDGDLATHVDAHVPPARPARR